MSSQHEDTIVAALYAALQAIRGHVALRVGPAAADDVIQETITGVLAAMRSGREISNPQAFCLAVLRYTICAHYTRKNRRAAVEGERLTEDFPTADGIEREKHFADPAPNPEQLMLAAEKRVVCINEMQLLPERSREVLERFYFRGQSRDQIMSEMGITQTQFRLVKSRAKGKLADRLLNAA